MRSQDEYLTEYAGDVVEHLSDEHEELRTLIGRVLPASGRERQAAFDAVRDLLARHEAAEQSVVRPLVRALPGAEGESAQRSREEDRITRALEALEQLDVRSIPFTVQFRELAEAVERHAELEQQVEFTLLRENYDADTLRRARAAVVAAEQDDPAVVAVPGGSRSTLLDRARALFTDRTP